jgi:hypothetical protein
VSTEREIGWNRSDEYAREGGAHAAPEGAAPHPLIDLARDPNPGRPNHAKPEGE